MDTIVLDIETKKTFREIGWGKSEMRKLGVSMVGIYSYQRDEYRGFREDEFDELENWLKGSGQIVGFNLLGFDYPVLRGHLDFDFKTVKTVDIMADIKKAVKHRISLNSVAKTTLGIQKSADGLKAIQLYHQGEWEELEKYCLDDVRITRELFDYGCKHKLVKITTNYGSVTKNISVNWSLLEDNYLSPARFSQERLL